MIELTTRTARVWLDSEGIVHLLPHTRCKQDFDDAVENVRAVAVVSGHVQRPLIVHFQIAAPQTAECRAHYVSAEGAQVVTATAIVTESTLGRIIGNLMMGMSSSALPIRLFDRDAAALEWLRQYLPTELRRIA